MVLEECPLATELGANGPIQFILFLQGPWLLCVRTAWQARTEGASVHSEMDSVEVAQHTVLFAKRHDSPFESARAVLVQSPGAKSTGHRIFRAGGRKKHSSAVHSPSSFNALHPPAPPRWNRASHHTLTWLFEVFSVYCA